MTSTHVTPPSGDGEEEAEERENERHDAHLEDVEVGAGCTEIWEHLADERDGDED